MSHQAAPTPAARRMRWLSGGWIEAGVVGVVATIFYTYVGFQLYRNLHSGMDLAIFDQAVRCLSHFQAPVSPMKAPGMNLWGDHLHLILVAAAPFYWVWSDPRMLVFVQALSIGGASAITVRTAFRHLGSSFVACSIGAALALGIGVQFGAVFDFHEVALGMPVLAAALSALLKRDWRWFTVWSLVMLTVKEDAGVFTFGLAIVAFIYGKRVLAGILAAASVAWTLLAIYIIIPALSPTHTWAYGNRLHGIAVSMDSIQNSLIGDSGLAGALFVMLLATVFLATRSWLVLAALPSMLSRAVGDFDAYWRIYNHYNMLPSVIFVMAAIEALTRLDRRRAWAGFMALFALIAVVRGPAWAQANMIAPQQRLADAQRAFLAVPRGESVAADAYLTPHLTKYHPITQQVRLADHLGNADFTDDLNHPLIAQYLILDRATKSNGGNPAWVDGAIKHFSGVGYREIGHYGDFVVMTKA